MKLSIVTLSLILCSSIALAKEIKPIPDIYKEPYKYFSKSSKQVASILSKPANRVGNIIIDTKDFHILFEARNNVIGFADVEIKGTGPCSQKVDFDSPPLLKALGINPNDLELNRKATHSHRYYDHTNKLKIVASCSYDGAPLSVSFSKKYYLH